jgi:hypothetical protein
MKQTFKLFALVAILITTFFVSCSKDGASKPGNTPQTSIPAPFAGNWSSNSVGLITYWDQGSYSGSYGNTVFTVSLNDNGTAAFYGYYEGAYSSIFFFRYACSAAYKEESDGTVTITVYPYSGEQIIGSGPKKPIGANSLYPNNVFVLKHCNVYTDNGKTYLSYYELDENGGMPAEPTILEKL